VLLLDDDATDRQLIRRLLERTELSGLSVVEASSSEEALAVVREQPIDCVLADVSLCGQSGLDFVALAKQTLGPACPPVIMMTGHAHENIGVRSLKAGAVDFVEKGTLSEAVLEQTIRTTIETHAAQQLHLDAERSERMAAIGRLVASVAHELNNPTAYALMNAEYVRQEIAACQGSMAESALESIGEAMQQCTEGLQRIATIVRELKSFSNVQSDNFEPTSVNTILGTARRLTTPALRKIDTVDLNLSSQRELSVDSGKLIQVAINLMQNAAHFCPQPDGKIVISSWDEDDGVAFAVDDNGPGIPLRLRTVVFDPFFTTRTADGGTGLGLALSAEYVHQHGGKIDIQDSELGGARIEVHLPLSGLPR
jgi:signal transduction histidine kinase